MEMVEEGVAAGQYINLNDDVYNDGSTSEFVEQGSNCSANTNNGADGVPAHQNASTVHVNACLDGSGDTDVYKMEFESTKEAETFYILYARTSGFGVRKGYKRKDKSGFIRRASWLCNKEGQRLEKHMNRLDRIREPKAVTRENCQACFKIKYDNGKDKYVVSEFVTNHSHPLCSSEVVKFMRSHRKVSDGEMQQAQLMKHAGIRVSHIMRVLALQAGGYCNLHFQHTDMYKELNRQRQISIGEGDAESAIAYLSGKQGGDPNLFYKFAVDDEGRLTRLLWADSMARDDYRCFGDVLVFDSTYNSNHYKFPLVVLCGVNHHYCTCMFACALIVREGDEAYDWVLSTFLEAMEGKKPISVVTDGDKSMRKAIKKFFPAARHRLCSFHLEMNATTNVRDKEFLESFKACMFMNCSPERFEVRWAEVVTRFGLTDNDWVNKMYRKKHLWAMAFLRGNFFAGIRSTQRCEKMHHVLKLHLVPQLKFYECLQAYDLAVARLRHEESRNTCVTDHTSLLPATQLHALEKHASDVFTLPTFLVVREEMKKQGLFIRTNGTDDGMNSVHFMRHPYQYSQYMVAYNRSTGHMKCSCLKLETQGFPCSHMFRAMLFEELKRIPDTCILKRWTRQAKEGIVNSGDGHATNPRLAEMARYSTLVSASNGLCAYACKSTQEFGKLLEFFHTESVRVRDVQLKRQRESSHPGSGDNTGYRQARELVMDPNIRTPRGAGRGKVRQGGHCMRGKGQRSTKAGTPNTIATEIRVGDYGPVMPLQKNAVPSPSTCHASIPTDPAYVIGRVAGYQNSQVWEDGNEHFAEESKARHHPSVQVDQSKRAANLGFTDRSCDIVEW